MELQPGGTVNFLRIPHRAAEEAPITNRNSSEDERTEAARINSAYACKLTGRSTIGFGISFSESRVEKQEGSLN